MVLALIDAIAVTKGLRTALPFIQTLVEALPGASAREIIQTTRGLGFAFSDAPAFNIIAQLKSNLDTRALFKLTDFTKAPTIDTLERSVTPLNKNYSFLVSINGFNGVTGARERRHITIVSDTILTPEQIISSALSLPSGSPGSQILSNATVSIVSGKVSPFAL